ncbi:MAG: 50S ribosomal protein L11 methyltransferase [Alistipes sp.]|nr:50S ribosomal protein L11 methyltransferase [Alistipes sp.]
MEYVELNISVADAQESEIVMALLSDYAFEAFDEQEGRLLSYIQLSAWAESRFEVEAILRQQELEFTVRDVEPQNWNQEWESGFEPVDIDGETPIRIRAAHHLAKDGSLDIVIAPRMSFGTGHHSTTALMSATIAEQGVESLSGLDMGCGTGVLAIVALKCGARKMVAVDIDDWACDSCRDSIALSGVAESVDVRVGSIDVVQGEKFDFILANINRNILQSMMEKFSLLLERDGWIAMSGFLDEDAEAVEQCAAQWSMVKTQHRVSDGWVVMVCKKL